MDKNIGKRLDGRYEITELIGVGGMADVYKANDIVDKKTVAVKILKKEFAENEEFLRRFRNESKAIAVLSHPNIVKIYDVGFSEKIQFIVMEYIDGITLKEYMEAEQVLGWKDAVHFITQILRALQHAHGRGIVHRDIKPQNIMMFPDGTIKVMDFGIAKFARETGKTATDQAIGTVHYISPEQARGDVTDEKSDVYSVGVMFYEMLTGKKPFDTDNPVTIAVMHMQATPERPRDINPDIPIGLEEIILHAMQKDTRGRYQSALEMMQDIERFKENPDIVFGYEEENGYSHNGAEETPTRFFKPIVPEAAPAASDDEDVYEEESEDEGDEDYEYEEEGEERRSLFVPILTGVTITVIVVAVMLLTSLIMNFLKSDGGSKKEQFQMPTLIGMDFNEAKIQYHDAGKLEFNVIASEYSPDGTSYEKDQIFYQSVEPNDAVSLGQRIDIKISLGVKTATVPDVTNWEKNLAITTLRSQGFEVQPVDKVSDTVEAGKIVETVPAAGEALAPGAKILVYVSKGANKETFACPDFLGKSIENAIVDADVLEIEIVQEEVDSKEEKGTIVKQSITKGTQIEAGTSITLQVSNGNAPAGKCRVSFTLPDNVSGSFTFSFYDSGSLFVSSQTINAAYTTGVAAVDLTGSGKKEFVVVLTNTATSKTATVGTYSVDFEHQTFTALAGVNVSAAFTQVGLVHAVTTAPPTTTTHAWTTAKTTAGGWKPSSTAATTTKPTTVTTTVPHQSGTNNNEAA